MSRTKKEILTIGRRSVEVSNLNKPYFPESGFSKGDVISYYRKAASVIVPHLENRPLTLKRYPEGTAGGHFYQKDAPRHAPDWIKTYSVERREARRDNATVDWVLINDEASLIWTVNLGNIEIHTLLAKAPRLERPSSVVFDLDPGPPAGILACCQAALLLFALLAKLHLQAFVKVSGSKGVHLHVPLNGQTGYEVTRPFAKAVADYLALEHPHLITAQMAKTKRKGKVFIDWSQNDDFKSTAAPYSLRAKSSEPFVALPVEWSEIERALTEEKDKLLYFTPQAALERLDKLGDLFAPLLTLKQKLPRDVAEAARAGARPRKARGTDISAYEAKRDFTRTAEPPALDDRKKRHESSTFVVQKHQASRLHYDFRLEMEGVLRSWAVPKGASFTKGERRLAMHVEDHPLDYRDFEGTIPPGNYGAGTVMVWDRGAYSTGSGDPAAEYYAGKMRLELSGEKLKGEWLLVRTAEANKWYLIRGGKNARPVTRKKDDQSVLSGRTMRQIAEQNTAQWVSNGEVTGQSRPKKSVKKRRLPGLPHEPPHFIEPMELQTVKDLPSDGDWIYEVKFDGFRALLIKQNGDARLLSRRDNDFTARYPVLTAAADSLRCGSAVIDGEIVVVDKNGVPSFQALQNFARKGEPDRLFYYAFDLLNLEEQPLLSLPLERRRELLESLLPSGPIRFSEALAAPRDALISNIRKLGLEGIVAKKKGSRYEPGKRSGAWVKLKLNVEQEFVIGGFTKGSPFDALLAGYYEKRKLIFAGKVTGGFNKVLRRDLMRSLEPLKSRQCPFSNLPEKKSSRWGEGLTEADMTKCVWLKPVLVAQVAFTEWTEAGHLRHPSFLGLREDKEPRSVVREP